MYWLRPPLAGEGFMLGCMQRLLREGDVVYDIGANIGLYSRFSAQYFKASRVYAFEPVESNRALLAENLKIGGCSARVTIVPFAVGNQDGTSDFQIDDLTSNSGTLDAVTQGSPSQSHAQYGLPAATIPVTVVRLDTIVHAEGFAKPDLIKLDVEGAEALALEGARAMLSDLRPHLLIELHGVRPARDVLHVCGIGEHQRELAVGQNVPDRLPVHSRCLHGDMGATVRRQPLRQAHKAGSRRVECLHLGDDFTTGCDAHTGDHAVFVDIETGTSWIKDFHLLLLPMRCRRGIHAIRSL